MDFFGLFKYCFIFFNFFILYYLKKIKEKERIKKLSENDKKTVLLITAHPDDESMFFIPTISNIKNIGYKINILCLSNGNSERREEEFLKATKFLQFDKVDILDLRSEGIKDGMNE